jgi:hypothetical protein
LYLEGLTPSLFLCKIVKNYEEMNKDKLKLIVKNLELLVSSLKEEIYSDPTSYRYEDSSNKILDYDEVFEDDD